MSGHVGNLSPQQQATLDQLKTNIRDVTQPHFDDYYLLRWLRARDFDLAKAETMLRKHLAWRKLMKVDELMNSWQMPEVLKKYYPGGLFGFAKDGSPVYIEPAGRLDPKGLFRSCKKSDIIKMKILTCERIQQALAEQSKRIGRKVENIIVINDFEHYGMKHMWKPAIDLFNEIAAIFEAHYPEVLKKCFIVNVNPVFYCILNIAKPFLSEETRKKVIVLGRNSQRRILRDIDPDQLPVHWGGTCTDPDGDPYCSSRIPMGGEVPRKFHYSRDELSDFVDARKITVGRSSKTELEYTTDSPNCLLAYQFLTEAHDITFSVYYRRPDSPCMQEADCLLNMPRINSSMVAEDGCVQLGPSGTYVVVFDNSFSWVSSRKVVYHIEILEAGNKLDVETASVTSDDSYNQNSVDSPDHYKYCTHL